MPKRFPPTTLPLAIGLLVVSVVARPGQPLGIWDLIALWLIAAELHVTLHELGHALSGAAAGFRVYALDTGLLHVRFRPTVHVGLQQRIPLWLAGFTRTAPVEPPTRRQQAVLVLGGPFLSLATGLAALAFSAGHLRTLTVSRLAWFSVSYTIVALASTVFALLPRRTMRIGVPSDGALLLSIARGQSQTLAPWVSRLRVQTSLGLRPHDTDVSLDEALSSALKTGALDGGQELILAAVLALDGPTPTRARDVLETALAMLGDLEAGNVRDVLHLSVLYFALIEPDLTRSKADLERLLSREDAKGGFAELAEAAVRAAESPESARAHVAAWLTWTEGAQVPGFRRAGNEWALERLASRGAVASTQ